MASNKSALLTEYCEVTRELEKIRNKVVILRDLTETEMARAKSERSKKKIFDRFQRELDRIKKDKDTKIKYKKLKKRQLNLEEMIMKLGGGVSTQKQMNNIDTLEESDLFSEESMARSNHIAEGISSLIAKYEDKINEKVILTGIKEYSGKKTIKKNKTKSSSNEESTNRVNRIIKIPDDDSENKIKTQKIKKLYSLIDNLQMDM